MSPMKGPSTRASSAQSPFCVSTSDESGDALLRRLLIRPRQINSEGPAVVSPTAYKEGFIVEPSVGSRTSARSAPPQRLRLQIDNQRAKSSSICRCPPPYHRGVRLMAHLLRQKNFTYADCAAVCLLSVLWQSLALATGWREQVVIQSRNLTRILRPSLTSCAGVAGRSGKAGWPSVNPSTIMTIIIRSETATHSIICLTRHCGASLLSFGQQAENGTCYCAPWHSHQHFASPTSRLKSARHVCCVSSG